MHNPLINGLNDFSDNQLEEKVMELQRKYFMTANSDLKLQIANVLEIYKEELRTRRAIAAQRQREQLNQNGETGLDNLINIS